MYHCSLMEEEGKKNPQIYWLYFLKKPFSCFPFYGLLYLYIVIEKQYSVLYYVLPLLLGSPYCVHLAVITMFYWPSSNNEASSIEQDACNGLLSMRVPYHQSRNLPSIFGHLVQLEKKCRTNHFKILILQIFGKKGRKNHVRLVLILLNSFRLSLLTENLILNEFPIHPKL